MRPEKHAAAAEACTPPTGPHPRLPSPTQRSLTFLSSNQPMMGMDRNANATTTFPKLEYALLFGPLFASCRRIVPASARGFTAHRFRVNRRRIYRGWAPRHEAQRNPVHLRRVAWSSRQQDDHPCSPVSAPHIPAVRPGSCSPVHPPTTVSGPEPRSLRQSPPLARHTSRT